ncbi:hypothetical protein Ancab_033492 [Ancistrocladus abbreviatus]
MRSSGPAVEKERSRKGHLGPTQADEAGPIVGLEDCLCGPIKGIAARPKTNTSLAQHQKRRTDTSLAQHQKCRENEGVSTSKKEVACISVTGGSIGDSGIQNMNRIFLLKKDCETAEEICKLGQHLGKVPDRDEEALIERLKDMEQRNRIAWEKLV